MQPIETEINGHSKVIVTFGGIKGGIGMPQFEFKNILKGVECDKIFIRDLDQVWYQKGIHGHPSLDQLCLYLHTFTKDYVRAIFLGNSMGGYAALYFSVLANKVIAFNPQTVITKQGREKLGDERWEKHLSQVADGFDLADERGNADIFYGTKDPLDVKHAERMTKSNLWKFDAGHGLVGELKKSGELQRIIKDTVR